MRTDLKLPQNTSCCGRGVFLSALAREARISSVGGAARACGQVAVLFLGVLGCSAESVAVDVEVAELTTGSWPPALPVQQGADIPVDPRDITMHPDAYAGQERFCDLTFLGEASEGGRRTIRCIGPTGTGWADLVFPAAARELAEFVREGERIRVLVTGEGGLHGYPRLEFVADIGPVEGAHKPRPMAPALGSDWYAIAEHGDREMHRCAVSWVGPILPIEDAEYSHEARVSCHSRAGEHWVRMRFPEVTHPSALRFRRGEVVPARMLNASGSTPLLRYEGP